MRLHTQNNDEYCLGLRLQLGNAAAARRGRLLVLETVDEILHALQITWRRRGRTLALLLAPHALRGRGRRRTRRGAPGARGRAARPGRGGRRAGRAAPVVAAAAHRVLWLNGVESRPGPQRRGRRGGAARRRRRRVRREAVRPRPGRRRGGLPQPLGRRGRLVHERRVGVRLRRQERVVLRRQGQLGVQQHRVEAAQSSGGRARGGGGR